MTLISVKPRKRRTNHGFSAVEVDRYFNDIFNHGLNNFFGADFVNNIPAVNVIETSDNFQLEIAAPGLKKSDFEVKVEDGGLTIKANKEAPKNVAKENIRRREFDFSQFSRRFKFPETVSSENITATYENGILKLILPKKAKFVTEGAQKIEIQ